MVQEIEIWKEIPGFMNHYQISSFGRLKSLKFGKFIIRKPGVNSNGYRICSLYKKNIAYQFRINRLVAQAFIPNPENKPQVNHKKGNKLDNRAWMLEWCTQSENQIHAYKTGLQKPVGEKQVIRISLNNRYKKIYKSVHEAARQNNTDFQNISACIRGKRQTVCGYNWKYK